MKFNIINHIPPTEQIKCDRCETVGSRQYEDSRLCPQCTIDDVQERINDKND